VSRILPYFQDQITDADGKTFNLRKMVTLQDIADLTGLTRQTVSKVLQKDVMRPNKARKKALG
jgi:CRP-like cAMP-binding protein